MATNVVNQTPFLRTSRNFPKEIQPLQVEVDKSYVDIANCVNDRVIGIFPTQRPAITGEKWYITGGMQQQTLRQVYTFTTTNSFNHNINITDPLQITRAWGTYTDGTNIYGLIFDSDKGINDQITFYITKTQVVFTAKASHPTLVQGRLIIEWFANGKNSF